MSILILNAFLEFTQSRQTQKILFSLFSFFWHKKLFIICRNANIHKYNKKSHFSNIRLIFDADFKKHFQKIFGCLFV